MIKAVFNWSGGKDSALALYKAIESKQYDIVALLTTVNRDTKRSSMHDIPLSILEKQAESIGIPLFIVDLTPKGTMGNYKDAMTVATEHFKSLGVTHFIFGDIFLHDVRKYREEQLHPIGIEVVEPLWDMNSEKVMEEFLQSGIKTIIVTTTADILDSSYIGKVIDREFIESLPAGVDPCGENGEYHTLVYDGGAFKTPIDFKLGNTELRTYPIKLDDGTSKDYSYWFAGIEG